MVVWWLLLGLALVGVSAADDDACDFRQELDEISNKETSEQRRRIGGETFENVISRQSFGYVPHVSCCFPHAFSLSRDSLFSKNESRVESTHREEARFEMSGDDGSPHVSDTCVVPSRCLVTWSV